MSVSFAVTAFEETLRRGPSVLDCISAALKHDGVDEIVVVDDNSSDFVKLERYLSVYPKVKLFKNEQNLGVFGNKLSAVYHSTGDWVINSDSDNLFSNESIDSVLNVIADPKVWYCPSFARPQFDYREYIGVYDSSNIDKLVDAGGLAHCFVNTGNQTVNREEYLKVFGKYYNNRADLLMPNYLDISERHRESMNSREIFNACDSLVFNYEWVKNGGTLNIVEGFEYDHYWTSGNESNYNRAPRQKEQLNQVLLGLLREVKV